MGRTVTTVLIILVLAFFVGFAVFPLLPVRDGGSVAATDRIGDTILGDDGQITWTWDDGTNQNHPLSNLELQRALNFLKARFGFQYDWVAETGELYPGGPGSALNTNYWEAVHASKQLAFVPAYENLDGAEWTRAHATDRLFSQAYFNFLTAVVKAEIVAGEGAATDPAAGAIPILEGGQGGHGGQGNTVLIVQPVTDRTVVYVNGRKLGPAPVEILGLPEGSRLRIGVYRNGYYSLEKWVTLGSGQTVVMSPRLSKMSFPDRLKEYTSYLDSVTGFEMFSLFSGRT